MEKVFTKRFRYILYISMLVANINLLLIFINSPINNKCGSYIEEFSIIDNNLDSVTNDFLNGQYVKEYYDEGKTLILELGVEKDTVEFVYSWVVKNDMSHFLGIHNYRLLGFVRKKGYDVFLLSNVNSITDNWNRFGKLVEPMDNKKYFKNLSYNNIELLRSWNVGLIYDGHGIFYKYYDGKVSKPYWAYLH